MSEHGPTICQKIGEPWNRVYYTDCFQCSFRLCPIRKLIGILRYVAPEEMEEVEAEIRLLPTTVMKEEET